MTRDTDFLAIHVRGDAHPGMVHWHGKQRNVKEAIHYLLQLGRQETSESLVGVVRYKRAHDP